MPDPSRGWKPSHAILLLMMVLLNGWTPTAARDAMAELPALSAGFVRFFSAGLLLSLTVLVLHKAGRKWRRIEKQDYGRFLLAAVLCVPINQATFLLGVQYANASHAGLFYGLNPVLVYIITVSLGHAVLNVRMSLAALLAFLGAAVVGWDGFQIDTDGNFVLGDLLLFGAVLSWAVYSVVAKPLSAKYGAVRALAIVIMVGSVIYAPVWLVDGHRFDLTTLSSRGWAGLLFITVGTSYLNYLLWLVAMNRIDINRLAVIVNISPIVAVIFAYYWRNEPISTYLVLGAALIFTAIGLANWDRLRVLFFGPRQDSSASANA